MRVFMFYKAEKAQLIMVPDQLLKETRKISLERE